jgi:hypothetical protein
MSPHYLSAIRYLATQGYAAIESIDLVAYLWHVDSKQVVSDIDTIRNEGQL